MDPTIWSNLPLELVRKIIELSDDIEVRIYFKIRPKKLSIDENFQFRNEIVYVSDTMTLWDFRHFPETFLCRKNIKFSRFRAPDMYVFNMEWEDYELKIFSRHFKVGPTKCSNHVVIHKRVAFK